jgi:3-methyladenine DNA glycosylase Tag
MTAASAQAWLERSENLADNMDVTGAAVLRNRAQIEAQIAQAHALEKLAAAAEFLVERLDQIALVLSQR